MITDSDNAQRIYENINEFVDSNDYICGDFRVDNPNSEDGKNNPTVRVYDSYKQMKMLCLLFVQSLLFMKLIIQAIGNEV